VRASRDRVPELLALAIRWCELVDFRRWCVLAFCAALAACDEATSLVIRMDAGEPFDPACFLRLDQAIARVDLVNRVPPPQSSPLEELQIVRGQALIHISHDKTTPNSVRISFSWMGSSDLESDKQHIQLLTDVRDAVIRACDVADERMVLTTTCGGSICRYPEAAALQSERGQDRS
jgi:hypothetical protein